MYVVLNANRVSQVAEYIEISLYECEWRMYVSVYQFFIDFSLFNYFL